MRTIALAALSLAIACRPEGGALPDAGPDPCPADALTLPDGTCVGTGWQSCSAEFVRDEAGGCRELAASDCPAGAMPVLGSLECQPVGWHGCPAGFEADPSGWGCREVLPAAACAGSTREALGQVDCVPVGSCDAPFPPAEATHFVDPRYTAGQLDATHHATLTSALQAAPAGAVIAVEEGRYDEAIDLLRPVTVVGRCPARVVLDAGARVRGVVKSAGVRGVALSGLTLTGGQGVFVSGGGQLTLTDVVLENTRLDGIYVTGEGSEAKGTRVVIRDVRANAAGEYGFGASAEDGARLELEESAIVRADNVGVGAFGDALAATTVLRGSVVRETNARQAATNGTSAYAYGPSRVELERCAILGSRNVGASAVGDLAQTVLRDSVVRSGQLESGGVASAIRADQGGRVSIERVHLLENVETAILANRGEVIVADSVVQRTRPLADGSFGVGAWAMNGGRVKVSGSAFVANAYYGLHAEGAGASVEATRTVIRDTQADPAGHFGRGIDVLEGGRADCDACALLGNHQPTVFVHGAGADGTPSLARLGQLVLRDSLEGSGITVRAGARLLVEGAVIERATQVGVFVDQEANEPLSSAELVNVLVRDTRPHPLTGSTGSAIATAGSVTVRSSALVENRWITLFVGGSSGTAVLENVTIRDTRPDDDPSEQFEYGVAVASGASIVMGQVDLVGHAAGLVVDRASGTVRQSLVRRNQVAVYAQGGTTLRVSPTVPATPPPGELAVDESSAFVDNATRVGTGSVPLPEFEW